jgi:uncharacterized protein (TIGR02246 family)
MFSKVNYWEWSMSDTIAAEAAVRSTLSRVAAAWGDGDPDRYAALFTEDADYTAFDGTRMAGRQAIARCSPASCATRA